MRQGDFSHFKKPLYKVKESDLQLGFNTFRQPSTWHRTKTNNIKLQTIDPEISSILIFQKRVSEQVLHQISCMIFHETIFSYYVPTGQISFSNYLYFSRHWAIYTLQLIVSQNHFHNILRLFDILLVKKMLDYYLQTWYIRVVLHVTKIQI